MSSFTDGQFYWWPDLLVTTLGGGQFCLRATLIVASFAGGQFCWGLVLSLRIGQFWCASFAEG